MSKNNKPDPIITQLDSKEHWDNLFSVNKELSNKIRNQFRVSKAKHDKKRKVKEDSGEGEK